MDGSDDASARDGSSTSARGREEDCADDSVDEEEQQQQHRDVDSLLSAEVWASAADDDVSVRDWLDQPGRAVDLLECLHVFRQVVQFVGASHLIGGVLGSIRPSCFVMSRLSRVSFVDSPSCSSSDASSDSGEDASASSGPDPAPVPRPRTRRPRRRRRRRRSTAKDEAAAERPDDGGKMAVPSNEVLNIEPEWYASPEEAAGGRATMASDVYRLGVFLFELFCTFGTMEEKLRAMSELRHRLLPPQLLLKWPKQASFCLWLLHPQPDTRPKMSEVVESEFFRQPINSLDDRQAAITLRDEIEDQDVLYEFLLHLQKRKQETAEKLHAALRFLSDDIEEAVNQQSIIKLNSCSNWNDDHWSAAKLRHSFTPSAMDEDSSCSAPRKRFRPVLQKPPKEEMNTAPPGGSRSEGEKLIREKIIAQSSRLNKDFGKLEAAYFSTRCRLLKPSGEAVNERTSLVTSSSADILVADQGNNDSATREHELVNPFLEGLRKYFAFSKMEVRADLKQSDLLNSTNVVCSMGFDRDKEFFATAGVKKKIKIFECDAILGEDRDVHCPILELENKSKISCVCWNGYIKSQIASSDFDGAVQIWDVARSQVLAEMREHERRVWSVDFSLADPTKFASGSDDGAVKLWSINQAGSVDTIRTMANVCSVHFQPGSAYALAVGSADHKIYCYDLRTLRAPCYTLNGHMRTVSNVNYLDSSTVVSASTDNSLKLWDLSTCSSGVLENPLQTFTGHTNIKNFVGLSTSDGYIATGSETNEVFVYHKVFPTPVLSYKFSPTDPLSGQGIDDKSKFVSAVCWRGESSMLLAASSNGNIKLLEMV